MNTLLRFHSFDSWGTNNLLRLRSLDSWGTNTSLCLRSFESWGTNTSLRLLSFDILGTNKFVILRPFDIVEGRIYSFWSQKNCPRLRSSCYGAEELIPPIPQANVAWAHICKRLRSPGIDSKEPIPLTNVAWTRICKRLRSPGIDSASLCNLASRYNKLGCRTGPPDWESIPSRLKRFTNTGSGGPVQ